MLARYKKLFESIKIELSPNAKNFLLKWGEGSTQALNLLNKDTIESLQKSLQRDTYFLTRGIKFQDIEDAEKFFGTKIDTIKRGQHFNIEYSSPTSWTKSINQAKLFSNWMYDTHKKKYFDAEDFESEGIQFGDMIGVGIQITSKISKNKLLLDMENIPRNYVVYPEEKEIVALEGTFQVIISNIEIFHRKEDEPEEDYRDLEVAQGNDEKIIKKKEEILKRTVVVKSIDTDEKLIKWISNMANSNYEESWAIAFMNVFPSIQIFEYIKSVKTKFKKDSDLIYLNLSLYLSTKESLLKLYRH